MDSKNIKDYLHFYLGCECIINWENPEYEENGKVCKLDSLRIYEMLTEYPEAICKPILRPLSDMTEEEEKEMIASQDDVRLEGYPQILLKTDSGETFRWMLSKGFDLFGLHDAGLCLYKNANGELY
jgi:hypothetical protein